MSMPSEPIMPRPKNYLQNMIKLDEDWRNWIDRFILPVSISNEILQSHIHIIN